MVAHDLLIYLMLVPLVYPHVMYNPGLPFLLKVSHPRAAAQLIDTRNKTV